MGVQRVGFVYTLHGGQKVSVDGEYKEGKEGVVNYITLDNTGEEVLIHHEDWEGMLDELCRIGHNLWRESGDATN